MNLYRKLMITTAIAGLSITACKKNDNNNSPDVTSDQVTNASDAFRMASETDDATDEANSISLNYARFRGINYQGIISGSFSPCNATVDTSMINLGTITITYNGLNCNGKRNRTGSIILQLPFNNGVVTPWSDQGCILTITFNSFHVTRVSDNKSWTFNGTKNITNVTGGLIDNSTDFITPIVHHITASLQLTFDNGTTRTWNVDRTRTVSRNNNITTISTVGNASENGLTNVSEWGTNRLGNIFTITINSPIVQSSSCGYNPMSGIRVHHGVVRELTVTFGVDASGNSVTSGCPYGYKLNWTNQNGIPKEVVLSY